MFGYFVVVNWLTIKADWLVVILDCVPGYIKHIGLLTGCLVRKSWKCNNSQEYSAWNRLYVHPEGHPGHGHNENGWQVVLNQVETDWSLPVKLGNQTAIVSWIIGSKIALIPMALASQPTHIYLVITVFSCHHLQFKLWHSQIFCYGHCFIFLCSNFCKFNFNIYFSYFFFCPF